jgi:hypothetical protein
MPVWFRSHWLLGPKIACIVGAGVLFAIVATLTLTADAARGNVASMNTPKFQTERVASFLKRRKIATLDEIGAGMGSASKRTVFRKLSQLEYLSSYSHRGKFYTLKSIAKFTAEGLWSLRSVWFSRFGNLLQTAAAWVHRSERGYSAAELTNALHVDTKHALTRLARQGRLHREIVGDRYVYFSADDAVAKQQRKCRDVHATASQATALIVSNPDLAVAEAKATLLLFFSMLNEKQRRLYAGLESLKLGRGGDAHIAALFGIDPHTVARGRRELAEGQVDEQTVRIQGGGRLSQEKKRLT